MRGQKQWIQAGFKQTQTQTGYGRYDRGKDRFDEAVTKQSWQCGGSDKQRHHPIRKENYITPRRYQAGCQNPS